MAIFSGANWLNTALNQFIPVRATMPVDASGNASGPAIAYVGTSTPLTASATFTGATRDTGVAVGSGVQPYAYFNAFFRADQTGTASIEASIDGTTWFTAATSALAANTPLILQVPVFYQFHRAKLVNGSTGQGSMNVATSYTVS